MNISDAAAEALASGIREANKRLGKRRPFGVAVVPTRQNEFFDIFLVKTSGGLEKENEKRGVKRALVSVRIEELLVGRPLKDPVVFLHRKGRKKDTGIWRSVTRSLGPVRIGSNPIVAPYPV